MSVVNVQVDGGSAGLGGIGDLGGPVGPRNDPLEMGPAELAISSAAGVASQILFASMGAIVYAVLYFDLRNRREGTDIAERLSQLEIVQPAATDG